LSEKEKEIVMCKKLIYLISFVVALSLASITYGDGVVIGNFEDSNDPNHDGWSIADGNVTVAYSSTGVTLDSNSLKINSPKAGGTGGFRQALNYSLVVNNEVNEFRNNLKVSLDLTRLYGEWTPDALKMGEWSEFLVIVQAGRIDANFGTPWTFAMQLNPDGRWSGADGSSPMSVTYDYSLALNHIDFDNLEYLVITLATNWGLYTPGGVYYLDNVKLVGEGMAYEPSPADHAVDVNVQGDPNLRWTKGAGATSHDVYFGTNFNDVNDANRASHPGLLRYSQDQEPNYYDPGTLELYTTYYWRIDEVNGPDIRKGAVWDFMTAYAGMGVVIGDWENGMNGWEATSEGETTFSYSTKGATLGDYSLGVNPVRKGIEDPGYWIIQRYGLLNLTNMKLQFDVTLIASEWNNEPVTIGPLVVQSDLPGTAGWRVFPVTAINRLTGGGALITWHSSLGNVYKTCTVDFTTLDGIPITNWANATWMRLRLALQNGDQGLGNFYLDNARLLNVFLAGNPRPATCATDVIKTPTLGWTKGKSATSHDVYFGTDETAVTNATKTSDPCGVYKTTTTPDTNTNYVPGLLEKNKTYYWRIDENGAVPSPGKGLVWHFTTAEYVFVDDFESYTNTSPKRIGDPNGWINGGGGTVGYPNSDYAEITIVHGGLQSMPFDYNNVGSRHDSNATRTFVDPCDWTAEGVKSLELWFRGWPASVGSWVESSGTHTITASGEDIWNVPGLRKTGGYHDEFHYAYKEITGDAGPLVTIIAKVESVSNTNSWAKAGVMIRQSLDPNSKNGFMCITPDMGAAFQYRVIDANVSTSYDYQMSGYESMADINAPYWVKLEIYTDITEYGNLWAYYSANGTDWELVISDSPVLAISPTLPIYVGLAVTAHDAAATCTAEFSNVSITAPGMTISSWSHQDIGIKSNIAAPLYVTLQDDNSVSHTATVTHPDPNIVLQSTWQAWDIALSDFTGVDLAKIKKITLGVGYIPADPCGRGTLYFDDIRLYLPRCMPNRTGDFNGDCFIDYDDLWILASNWLSSPADPNIDLYYKDNKINFKDYAILANKWFKAALWP
jgi:hypothetical protein